MMQQQLKFTASKTETLSHLKVLNGVTSVNECFPAGLTVATFRGTENEAMPSWKPSLLG